MIEYIKISSGASGVALVEECLPSKCEINTSIAKKIIKVAENHANLKLWQSKESLLFR
jgi:ribosomal protein S25